MLDHTNLKNMHQLLSALERECSGKTILKYMSGMQVLEVSGNLFYSDVHRCAEFLKSKGLSGKHIGIMGANRPAWMVHLCAVFEIGAVAVLLAPDLNPEDLRLRARQTDIFCILHDEALSDVAKTAADSTDILCISMDQPMETEADAICTEVPEANPEDLCCILFTSGTTSISKAVMLSHKAMIAGICHNIIRFPFDAQLAVLPLHHIAGFASVLNTWYLGRVLCLGEEMKYLTRYLQYMKPDYVLTVPSILQVILHKLKKGGPNGNLLGWDLHLVGCGGAQFQPEVIQALNEKQIRVLQSYGATEVGGLGFDWEMTPQCRGTIGKPCPEIDIKIEDGELFLRCDSMMTGYYKDPEATREVLIDGWYATGDLCRQDAEGFLYLTGRKKNLIILSNGENVSPEELESKLSACDAIAEIMVGVENDRIFAAVYPNGPLNDSTQNRIQEALDRYNASAPTYKQIHKVKFFDTPFAKTAVGKIIRSSVTGVNIHDHSGS